MKKSGAKGYLFEEIVKMLLKYKGFTNINSGQLQGRGASHQIDVFTFLDLPTPFINKLRLICEAKAYKPSAKISLPQLRSFVGVMKDISENYFVNSNSNLPERYTDVGVFFTTNQFSKPAQDFAWAHNISLVSFSEYTEWQLAVSKINEYIDGLSEIELEEVTIEELIDSFRSWLVENSSQENDGDKNTKIQENNLLNNQTLLPLKKSYELATINGTYPTFIEGNIGWLDYIVDNSETDEINAMKVSRLESGNNVIFNLYLMDMSLNFVLPDVISKNLVDIIDVSEDGAYLFKVEIPYHKKNDEKVMRRNIALNVYLEKIK